MKLDIGTDIRKMMTGDDAKTGSIEVVKILTNDKNIELKTDIPDPMTFALMSTVGQYLKDRYMVKTAKLINVIQDKYMRFAVSKDRQSRKEIIDVFKRAEEQAQRDVTDRLLHGSPTPG